MSRRGEGSRSKAPDQGHGSPLIDQVADWLMSMALVETTVEELCEGCFLRLHAAGIPLIRAHVAFRTLHPLYDAIGITWSPMGALQVDSFTPRDTAAEDWRRSPAYHMIETRTPFLRRRLTGPEALIDFAVLQDYRDRGATDYLVYLVIFDEEMETGIWGSWLTERPSGFSDEDIRALQRIQQRLSVALKVTIKEQIAHNVVATYLGAKAGAQVLKGRIRRGEHQKVHAAIWYSDMRDFTALTDTLSPEDLLALLNGYFECTAGAVLAEGGEVLLLIGDAVLAIFPIDGPEAAERQACERALAAAREAGQRLDVLNRSRAAEGQGDLACGIGLHVGELTFGNIGVPERLQFTVIGPAANEVARLEALTKTLGHAVLASAAFAERLPITWASLGRHVLRGVAGEREVFAPPDVGG